jgi:hypothetical protein
MGNPAILIQIVCVLAIIFVGIAIGLGPLVCIGWWILAPIDRAAKSRTAPMRFSVGDFLCLFLAIQIPLAFVYRFVGEELVAYYWVLTILTWAIAPIIWIACGHTLSKAGITTSGHRFVFLGLIMPLVYYGVIPFTLLGLSFLAALFNPSDIPFQWIGPAWLVLAILFFVSGLFVRKMLQQTSASGSISEREHETEFVRPAMCDNRSARRA